MRRMETEFHMHSSRFVSIVMMTVMAILLILHSNGEEWKEIEIMIG